MDATKIAALIDVLGDEFDWDDITADAARNVLGRWTGGPFAFICDSPISARWRLVSRGGRLELGFYGLRSTDEDLARQARVNGRLEAAQRARRWLRRR